MVYITLTALFTHHTGNALAERTAVIWGYPIGFCTRHWKPLSQVLKHDCVLESPGTRNKAPLLSPDGVAWQTGKAISFAEITWKSPLIHSPKSVSSPDLVFSHFPPGMSRP